MDFLVFLLRVKWDEADFVDLSNDLRIYTPTLPSSGMVMSFVVKIMDKLASAKKINKLSPNVYQLFVEAMKYGFAQRTNLGDKFQNEILNVTLQVETKR